MLRIKSPQDLGAGIVFVLIGIAGIYFGKDLRFGTASRMGPGFFPYYLSWIIVALGMIVGSRGFVLDGPPIERLQLRPMLFIVLACLFFGYTIEYLGVLGATIGLVLLAGLARSSATLSAFLRDYILLAAGLAVFVVVVFVWALRQPIPVWGGF